ncbi:hypothetical protein FQR65_LT20061 [Abscondita terminalis]|nr:hypothetical protein FQR65_LT20061 [Abscondita terminalis]
MLGFSLFRPRGFDTRLGENMLNGISTARPDNGMVDFSTWGGLNEITRYPEISLNHSPSEYRFGGVGSVFYKNTRARDDTRYQWKFGKEKSARLDWYKQLSSTTIKNLPGFYAPGSKFPNPERYAELLGIWQNNDARYTQLDWDSSLSKIREIMKKEYGGVGMGYNGGDALLIDSTPPKNDFVFTALSNAAIPANPKRITFYIKGKLLGKTLSFNVYKEGGTSYSAFNLGTFKNGAMLDYSQTNSYTGSIDTDGQWKLVELSLDGIDINRTPGKSLFAIKVGSNSAYNILIDNIKIE